MPRSTRSGSSPFGATPLSLILILAALACNPEPAGAQPVDERRWTAGVGRETLTVRDVSRSGIPIQTSPVGLEAHAWLAAGRYERRSQRRSHHLAFAVARSTSMDVRTPIATRPDTGDQLSRIEGRYEYRRAWLRDRLARGLAVEAGLVGLAAWQSLVTDTPPANRLTTRDTEAGGGGTAGLRLERWRRVTLETTWTMALVLGRASEDVDAARTASSRRAGGGWLLENRTGGSFALRDGLWLSAFYTTAGQARFASHRGQSDRRGRLEVTVTHVR